MNHVAFNVPEERFLECRARLKAKGGRVSPVLDHDESVLGVARELHPGVFVRSFISRPPMGSCARPTGTFTRKTDRQPSQLVSIPPASTPAAAPAPPIAPQTPSAAARCAPA